MAEYFAVAESFIGPFHYDYSDVENDDYPPSYQLTVKDSNSGTENTHSEVIKANHNLVETDIGPGLFVDDIVGATNGGKDESTPSERGQTCFQAPDALSGTPEGQVNDLDVAFDLKGWWIEERNRQMDNRVVCSSGVELKPVCAVPA